MDGWRVNEESGFIAPLRSMGSSCESSVGEIAKGEFYLMLIYWIDKTGRVGLNCMHKFIRREVRTALVQSDKED